MGTKRATLVRVAAGGVRRIGSVVNSVIPSRWKRNPFGLRERLVLFWQLTRRRLETPTKANTYEISAVIYSEACKRMLIPLLQAITQTSEFKSGQLRVNAV